MNDRAGQPATEADLVDVGSLVTAYYTEHPDPAEPSQQVAFGTSGHRGSVAAAVVQRGSHRGDDAGDLRVPGRRRDHRAALPRPGHARAVGARAWTPRSRCWSRTALRSSIDSRDGYTPTPALSRAILAYNDGRSAGLADGIVVTPSHNPPEDGGFKYNPPDGGPAGVADHRRDPAAGERAADRRACGEVTRVPFARARAAAGPVRLPRRVRRRAAVCRRRRGDPGRAGADRRRPAWRRQRRLLERDRRAVRARADGGEPGRRPDVPVHDARLGRPDPDGLLVAERDGVADRSPDTISRSRPATTPTPTGTAS